jgi:multidrug efflux pump subunit AcrB
MAVLVSGIVSVTLTPMLCSRLIKSAKRGSASAATYFTARRKSGFPALQRGYASSLRWAMRHRPFISRAFLGSIVATVQLFRIVPQDFLRLGIPARSTATPTAPTACSRRDAAPSGKGARILQNDPNIEGFMTSVGSGNARRPQLRRFPHSVEAVRAARIDRQRDHCRIPAAVSEDSRHQCGDAEPAPISIGGYVSRAGTSTICNPSI